MKKDKHITININEYEYMLLKRLADDDRRLLASYAALLLIDSINKEYVNKYSNNDNLQLAKYKKDIF